MLTSTVITRIYRPKNNIFYIYKHDSTHQLSDVATDINNSTDIKASLNNYKT